MKSHMLRTAVLVMFCCALAACSRQGEIRTVAESQKEIVLIAQSNGEFWTTVRMGAEAAAKEFDVKLTFDAPADETDTKTQIELVNKYLAYGADGLVLAANDYKKLSASVAKADRLGVPVVAIESDIDSRKVRSFVGTDNYEAGRQAARKMKELVGTRGRFLILGYAAGARNGDRREQGIRDEWAGEPAMQVVATAQCGLRSASCSRKTQELLAGQQGIDGILALSSPAATGAAVQIQKMKLAGQIKLVAFDNSPEELEWLQEGIIQATVIQSPFSMGYLGVKTAVESLDGQSVEKRIDTGTKVIDAQSMFWSDNQKMLFPFVQ
jgi:ribose transport system substrate-binding protein